MKYELPAYSDGIVKNTQTRFRGLNHNPGAGDGELYAMKNMSSDWYPLLATRMKRRKVRTLKKGNGLFSWDRLCWVDGKHFYYDGELKGTVEDSEKEFCSMGSYLIISPDMVYYNVATDEFGTLGAELPLGENAKKTNLLSKLKTESAKGKAALWLQPQEDYQTVTIIGDGKGWENYWEDNGITYGMTLSLRYRTVTEERSLELTTVFKDPEKDGRTLTVTGAESITEETSYGEVIAFTSVGQQGETRIEFGDGTLYDESATLNTVKAGSLEWADYGFKAGDAITFKGFGQNDGTFIVREVEGKELHFYEYTFKSYAMAYIQDGDYFSIRREVPDILFPFAWENRLWGCRDNTIYASKLGDPTNFNAYDGLSTDSWTLDVGGAGQFTGACSYGGYPLFFKEEKIFKGYGSEPANFEVLEGATAGVAAGSGESLAIAGETLFYLNRNGIYAYAGGLPAPIQAAFGTELFKNAVGGSDGLKYYVSMEDMEGASRFFVYDTQRGMWHEEESSRVVGFTRLNGNLYYLNENGEVWITGNIQDPPDSTEEEDFAWSAEFTDFTDDRPSKKDIRKLLIRLELEEGAHCNVWLQLDSDGEWYQPQDGTLEDETKRSYFLAIIPRRADHYRLKLEGTGGCKVYSISREFSEGSEYRSLPGRQ